jgi:predicted alpha/beta superfamily hydrolase
MKREAKADPARPVFFTRVRGHCRACFRACFRVCFHARFRAAASGLALSLLSGLASPILAQPDLSIAADTSILRDTTTGYRFETFERQPRADGPRYRVHLAVPQKAPPPGGYPALYLLDGNAVLDVLPARIAAVREAAASPVALVLVGYATPARFDVAARAFDYTPPAPASPGLEDFPGSGRKAGGAEIFRDFLVHRLPSELRRKVRLDPRRRTLWGHSYGGLFALHTLFAHPGDFQHYVAVSPALWWRDGWILREEAAFAGRALARPVTLLALSGVDEAAARPGSTPERAAAKQARNALPRESLQQLIARLDARDDLAARLVRLEGKTHGEMFAAGVEAALRAASRREASP